MHAPPRPCYVSIPFGSRLDAETGRMVDFERIYRELIEPAVQRAGLQPMRGEDFTDSLVHKGIAAAVISADVMLADVSCHNPNVAYELGIRHALRPSGTLLVSHTRVPSNLAQLRVLFYRVGDDGAPDGEALERSLDELARALGDRAALAGNDSPLYSYFPELQVTLPSGLQPPQTRRRAQTSAAQPRTPERKTEVKRAERALRERADADPQAYVDMLRRWATVGDWRELVRAAESLPADAAALPQVAQMQALAYSRLGDLSRAIEMLGARTTGSTDPDSLALLGSLYKKRYATSARVGDLDAAITEYRKGHAANPQDLYLGRNLAQLLQRRDSDAARAELAALLPGLRHIAGARIADGVPDFWTLDAALALALIDGDAAAAEQLVGRMLETQPAPWVLSAARDELSGLQDSAPDAARSALVAQALDRLAAPAAAEDDAEEADDAQL